MRSSSSRWPLCFGAALIVFAGCHERHPVAAADGPLLGRAPVQNVDFSQAVPSLAPKKLLKEPDKKIYRTRYRQSTEVLFDHKTHSKDYGIGCATCHHGEGCGRCHGRQERLVPVIESKAALHQSCVTCHQEMKSGPIACDDCHKAPGKPAPGAHVATPPDSDGTGPDSGKTAQPTPRRPAPASSETAQPTPERPAPNECPPQTGATEAPPS